MNIKPTSGKLKFWIKTILLIILLLVFLNLPFVSMRTKNFFYFISSPIQKNLWKAGCWTSDFFETIINIKNLKEENKELKLKTQELLGENIKISEAEKENKFLREALEIGLEKEFELTFAEVIGKDVSQDSILINKGFKNGILSNLPVITQQKVLIGKIGEVYEDFSKVILVSNPKSIFNVEIFRDEEDFTDNISGIIKGKGNFHLILDLIPREKEIKEGDTVITSSLGGVFPKGLLVGKIQGIKKKDVEPFQLAEIKTAFDIKELRAVFIINK